MEETVGVREGVGECTGQRAGLIGLSRNLSLYSERDGAFSGTIGFGWFLMLTLASMIRNVCKGTEVEGGKPCGDESTALILTQAGDAGPGREVEVEVVRRSGFWRFGRWRQGLTVKSEMGCT